MKRNSFFIFASAGFILVHSSLLHAAPVVYTITDLGVFGTVQPGLSSSTANAINSKGEIAGTATLSTGLQRAFLYDGSLHDLGSLRSGGASYGLGINDAGVVVGKSDAAEGLGDAFYYSGGVMVDMHTLPNGADAGSTAAAINAAGSIVGVSYLGSGATNPNAFLYTGGTMQDLGDLQGNTTSSYSGALAINSAGIIVGQGQLTTGDGTYEAFVYMGGKMSALPPLSNQIGSNANGINASGVIVGESDDSQGSGAPIAVAWTSGTPQPVPMVSGSEASVAHGINDAGQIVGYYVTSSGVTHAFVCTDNLCYDLNDIVAGGKPADFEYLVQANAINNSGTIVGYGYRKESNGGVGSFAFVAKPSVPTVIPPTPGTGMLTAAQNDPAPGLGTGVGAPVFSIAGPPAIDKNGDVAFRATIKETSKTQPVTTANNAGIWFYQATVGSLVARTGNPAPVTDNPLFTKLSDPVLSSDGDLAFIGTYAGGPFKVPSTTGVFVQKSGGSLALAYKIGDPAPTPVSNNAEFTAFEELAVENGGGVALLATMKGTGITAANNLGIWAVDDSSNLVLVAQKQETLPAGSGGITGLTALKPLGEVDGQSRSIDTINGNAAFLAQAKTPANSVILASVGASAFVSTPEAAVGAIDLTLSAKVKTLDEPIVNQNGSVAFLAALDGAGITAANDFALGLVSSHGGNVVVQTGVTKAPDAAGSNSANAVFSKLSDPVLNNADQYAFIASLELGVGDTAKTGSNAAGIWTNFGGALARVVRKGDPAPGTAGNYSSFKQLVLPDVGGPIFTASLTGVPASQDQGLWAVASGVPSLILETGNSLPVHSAAKTVRSFSVFQLPPLVMGQSRSFEATKGHIVYTATFTDGTWGIYSVVSF